MSLLEKTMAAVAAEYARKIEGLRRDAGLIAEAEALEKTIAEHMAGEHFDKPSVVITSHDTGANFIRLYVYRCHAEFRAALAAAGVAVESETELDADEYRETAVRRIDMRLAGFDVPAIIEYRPLQEAA